MRNCKILFASGFLLLLVFGASAQLSQREIDSLNDLKSAWPALDTSPSGPWGDPNIDDPCNAFWDGLYCSQGRISQLYVCSTILPIFIAVSPI